MEENRRLGPMESAVLRSVEARGDEITPSDEAAVELALTYARQVDWVFGDPEADRTERTKVLYLQPHLLKTLAELGCTPEARGAVKEVAEEVAEASTAVGASVLTLLRASNGR